jgi:hypothetical protein
MGNNTDDTRLIEAYLKHYATGDHSLRWAFDEVNEVTYGQAERGWNIALELIAAAPDDGALGYVAAGPLEEVLEVHGKQVIDRVENLARLDAKFRKALSLVACFEDSMPEDIRARVGRAVGRP